MSGRDDVPTVNPRVSADYWAQKFVEGLVESGAPEEELWAAIDEFTKHAKDMAKLALCRKEAKGHRLRAGANDILT
jgi:hypothetical protein